MRAETLSLTSNDLRELVEQRVDEILTPERIEQLAERRIQERIGQLTLEQAARHLQCKSVRQLTDFCREHHIEIERFGPRKRFVKLSAIEAAQKEHALKASAL